MSNKMKQSLAVINLLCRICGLEDKNCIPIFGESGQTQEIHKKIRLCLPLMVEESDAMPKQICLSCLHKLDATWELFHLCYEGELLIKQKLYITYRSFDPEDEQNPLGPSVEDKIRFLTAQKSVNYGESAVIFLAPPTPPPAPKVNTPPVLAPAVPTVTASVPTYVQPSTAASSHVNEEVYPQSLIQVPTNPAAKPIVYQQRSDRKPTAAPRRTSLATKPVTTPKRNLPTPTRRQALREGSSINVPPPKRSHQMCKFCNKSFPDDIIDHHVNLHLRQSFFTCLDCNKNFRSEEAMSRHRCGNNEPINLDPDDEPICL